MAGRPAKVAVIEAEAKARIKSTVAVIYFFFSMPH